MKDKGPKGKEEEEEEYDYSDYPINPAIIRDFSESTDSSYNFPKEDTRRTEIPITTSNESPQPMKITNIDYNISQAQPSFPILLDSQSLVDAYFKPLLSYSKQKNPTDIVSEPLWLYRQQKLSQSYINEYILNSSSIDGGSDDGINFLLSILKRTLSDATLNFSKLSASDKNKLLKIITTKSTTPSHTKNTNCVLATFIMIIITLYLSFLWFRQLLQRNVSFVPNTSNQAHGASILITLLMRDGNKDFRQLGINLLRGNTIELNSFKFQQSKSTCRSTFVDLTYANFIDLHEELERISLSGQDLRKTQWPLIINMITLRHTNLTNINFGFKTLQSKIDLTGALLSRANLVHSTIGDVIFNNALLLGANFTEAKFVSKFPFRFNYTDLQYSLFDEASFTEVVFKGCNLNSTSFEDTYAESITLKYCQTLSANEIAKSKAMEIKACAISIPFKVQLDLRKQTRPINITPTRPFDFQPNRFHEASDVHDRSILKASGLTNQKSHIHELITNLILASSQSGSYKTALGDKMTWTIRELSNKKIGTAIKRMLSSRHEYNSKAGIEIHKIESINNPKLAKRYMDAKKKICEDLKKSTIENPLSTIKWSSGNSMIFDSEAGECYLLHGTNMKNVPSIKEHSLLLRPPKGDFIQKNWGYGALGHAIYFSDLFAKSASYIRCKQCDQTSCSCKGSEKKAIFMCRVLLGNVSTNPTKSNKHATKPPAGYQSVFGPSKANDPISEFGCNEFAIYNEAQVLPTFCIYFSEKKLKKTNALDHELQPLTAFGSMDQIHNINEFSSIASLINKYHLSRDPDTLEALFALLFDKVENFENLLVGSHKHLSHMQKSFVNEAMRFDRKLSTRISKYLGTNFLTSIALETLAKRKPHDKNFELPESNILLSLSIDSSLTYCKNNPDNIHSWLALANTIKHQNNERNSMLVQALNHAWNIDKVYTERLLTNVFYDHKVDNLQLLHPNWSVTLIDYIMSSISLFQQDMIEDELAHNITWCPRVAKLFANLLSESLTFDQWEAEYWKLSEAYQIIFKEELAKVLKPKTYNQFRYKMLPNKLGERRAVSDEIETWESFLDKQLLNNKNGTITIKWVQQDGTVLKGSLNSSWANQLFHQGGINFTKTLNGRSHVVPLFLQNDRSSPYAYIKFYPKYPWRQLAIDKLKRRLSGLAPINTFAAVMYQDETYPIMISKSLGETYDTTFQKYNRNKPEKLIDPYYFTWEFIESWLIQNIDAKANNCVLSKLENDLHAWICFDSDRVLSGTPNVGSDLGTHSLLYCFENMLDIPSQAAMTAFSALKWKELLAKWMASMKDLTICMTDNAKQPLFKAKTLNALTLQHSRNQSYKPPHSNRVYNQASDSNNCFRDNDVPNIYRRGKKVIEGWASYQTEPKPKKDELEYIGHFRILYELHNGEAYYYWEAFEKHDNPDDRFQALSQTKKNFSDSEKYSSSNKSSSSQPKKALFGKSSSMSSSKTSSYIPEQAGKYLAYNPYAEPIAAISTLEEQRDKFLSSAKKIDSFEKKLKKITAADESILDFFSQTNSLDVHIHQKLIRRIPWNDSNLTDGMDFGKRLLREIMELPLFSVSIFDCPYLSSTHIEELITHSRFLTTLAIISCHMLDHTALKPLHNFESMGTLTLRNLSWYSIDGNNINRKNNSIHIPNLHTLEISHCKNLCYIRGLVLENLCVLRLVRNTSLVNVSIHLERLKKAVIADCPYIQFDINGHHINLATAQNIQLDLIKLVQSEFRNFIIENSMKNSDVRSTKWLSKSASTLNENIRKSRELKKKWKNIKLSDSRELFFNGTWFDKQSRHSKPWELYVQPLYLFQYMRKHPLSQLVLYACTVNDSQLKKLLEYHEHLSKLVLSQCFQLTNNSSESLRLFANSLKELHIENLSGNESKWQTLNLKNIRTLPSALPKLLKLTLLNCAFTHIRLDIPKLWSIEIINLPLLESIVAIPNKLASCRLEQCPQLSTKSFIGFLGYILLQLEYIVFDELPNVGWRKVIKHFWELKMSKPIFWNILIKKQVVVDHSVLTGYTLSKGMLKKMPTFNSVLSINTSKCLGQSRINLFHLLEHFPKIELFIWRAPDHNKSTIQPYDDGRSIERPGIHISSSNFGVLKSENTSKKLNKLQAVSSIILSDKQVVTLMDNSLVVWKKPVKKRSNDNYQKNAYRHEIICSVKLPDGRIATASTKSLLIWSSNFSSTRRLSNWVKSEMIQSLGILPNGEIIHSRGPSIRVWSTDFTQYRELKRNNEYNIISLRTLTNGQLAIGYSSGEILVLNSRFAIEKTYNHNDSPVLSINELPDGRLISGSSKSLMIWGDEGIECPHGAEKIDVLPNGKIHTLHDFQLKTWKLSYKTVVTNMEFLHSLSKNTYWFAGVDDVNIFIKRDTIRINDDISMPADQYMNALKTLRTNINLDFMKLFHFIHAVFSYLPCPEANVHLTYNNEIEISKIPSDEKLRFSKLLKKWSFIEISRKEFELRPKPSKEIEKNISASFNPPERKNVILFNPLRNRGATL